MSSLCLQKLHRQYLVMSRSIICRLDVDDFGNFDRRYIITSFGQNGAQSLWGNLLWPGNAELFIKGHKRPEIRVYQSCHIASASQSRLFLHSVTYMLMPVMYNKFLGRNSIGPYLVWYHLPKTAPMCRPGWNFHAMHIISFSSAFLVQEHWPMPLQFFAVCCIKITVVRGSLFKFRSLSLLYYWFFK